ncbi:hypothetical protein PTKIN_Ptkin05aG0005800 [Pterospermum kingtungense]
MPSSNTKSEDGAPPQNDPAKHTFIQRIINKLFELFNRLSETKKAFDHEVTKDKGSTETPVPDQEYHGDKPSIEADDGSQKKDGDKDGAKSRTEGSEENEKKQVQTQLDKACKELDYIISAFHKLDKFEKDMSEPLDTLENNVNDIQADLKEEALTGMVNKRTIERNLKVLRGNIAKVKMQIPLQKVSATVSDNAPRYLQTTVSSKVVGLLPNPYEAKEIFESSSFVKEFRDHYESLHDRRKLCLLCFAIFPEDTEVEKRLLKFWWLGERLSPEPDGDSKKKSQEQQQQFVDETLEQFVKMGFIEPVTNKSKSPPTSYKMHPIIRSLIIKFAKEAHFFDYDSKGTLP